jgi:hypothetical protein
MTKGNKTTGQKKAAAGRKGRGTDALTLKSDPDLQKRIDLVVEMAKARESSHSTDVMNEHRHVRRSSLKVIRVG